MSILSESRLDFAIISQDTDGFAEEVVLTSPTGQSATIACVWTDVGVGLDPESGQTVSAKAASVSISDDALTEAGIGIPVSVQEKNKKPWKITVTNIDGTSTAYKITEPRRDRRLGVHWFVLVNLQE